MAPTPPSARAPLPYAARGPAAGAVCAAGAVLAHAAAGGSVDPLAAVLALVASALLGRLLLRGPVDGAQTFALALVAQVFWHGAFLLTAAPGPAHSAAGMLLTHVVAAALTTVAALGVERELVLAACRRIGLVLPAPGVVVPPRAVRVPADAVAPVVPVSQPLRDCHALRAPPR
ncbi:hypothetical protein [Nocardioides aequoreus]|uniref:hypothetical protein n=1 Tax=Nocardioides aequoreus TaxID=397278 RepID=UPI0012F6EEAF|nr:hypothetical protein [Nocardioides aequoreus]